MASSNNVIGLIEVTLKTSLYLRYDQILVAGGAGDGYSHVYAVKGDGIVDLGQISDGWIHGGVNYGGTLRNDLVAAFASMCAEKYHDPGKNVPTLTSSPEFFDSAYKEIYKAHMRKFSAPEHAH